MTRLGWLVVMTLAALLLALLLLLKQGDCNRDDGDDDGDDDGEMEPACKPGDQACHAYEPAASSTSALDLQRADPGES